MFPSYLLSLREGMEAALVVGIVLGALRQLGRADCIPAVWAGVGSAVVLSGLTAVVLNVIGWSLEGPAEPIYEGVMLFTAAGLLTWMIFWVRRQARTFRSGLETGVQLAASFRGIRGVFGLTFIAVAREGVELALFLSAVTLDGAAMRTLGGAGLGLATATLLGWWLFTTTQRLNLNHFFSVTGMLLILFAAGLVANGVHELNEIGWIPPIIEPLWNTGAWLDEKSVPGSLLKSVFGYTSSPSLTAVLAYGAYLGGLLISLRIGRSGVKREPRRTTVRSPLVAAGAPPAP